MELCATIKLDGLDFAIDVIKGAKNSLDPEGITQDYIDGFNDAFDVIIEALEGVKS